jgi:hypothetical protein
MQMNKQNGLRSMLASLAAILLITAVSTLAVLAAENEPPTKQQPEPTVPKPTETSAETTIDPAKTPQTGQPAPAAAGTAVTPIKQFVPSEKIGADSAVAFPIDI